MSDPFLDDMEWRDECANDASGNGPDEPEDEPEHEHKSVLSLERCGLVCSECGQLLTSLNFMVCEVLRREA